MRELDGIRIIGPGDGTVRSGALHPGEPEAIIVLEGTLELHGSAGVTRVGAGDVLLIPPGTEHGLRTPTGGRWLAIWPIRDRVEGPRYRSE